MSIRRASIAIAGVIAASVLVAGLTLASTRAWAAFQVPEANPGLLSLWTDSYPLQYDDMDPGDVAYVQVDVQLADADQGDLSFELRKEGELSTVPGGLEITVEQCDEAWTGVPSGISSGGSPHCPSGAAPLLAANASSDYSTTSPRWGLGQIEDDTLVHLLVILSLPSSTPAADISGMSGTFGLGLFAEGQAAAAPPPALAVTGFDALSLLLIAVGAISLGVCVTRWRGQQG